MKAGQADMEGRPLVSISCITYNHEEYIQDAIEGFLMQEVDFPIEIIIHDDASTDNTANIIKEYERTYPDLIKPIYQKENQHAKGYGNVSYHFVFPKARGKYIALCDGDDYWTDPLKLQKQVAFMESSEDCSLCFHPTKVIYENENSTDKIVHRYNNSEEAIFEGSDLVSGKINAWTAALFFRSAIIPSIPEWITSVIYGDVALKMICAAHGDIGYIGGDAMCVYRRGVTGAWSEKEGERRGWEEERLENHIQLIKYFNEYTSCKFAKALELKKSKHKINYLFAVQDYCSKAEALKLISQNSKLICHKPKKIFWVCIRLIFGKDIYEYLIEIRKK